MIRKSFIYFMLLISFTLLLQKLFPQLIIDSATTHPKVELYNTEVRKIVSSKTDLEYCINIYLPYNYKKTDKKYAVLYLTDSESLNFGIYAGIHDLLSYSYEVQEIILVGIADCGETYNEPLRRKIYTPTKVENGSRSGEAAEHLRFIREDVIPFIEKEYRIDSFNRGLWGHSLGGLFAAFVLLNNSALFQNYLIASPSLWWDNSFLLKETKEFVESGQDMKANIYLFVGGNETNNMKGNSKNFYELLREIDNNDMNVVHQILNDESHLSVIPLAFKRGLNAIYQLKSIVPALEKLLKEKGIDAAKDKFVKLTETEQDGYDFQKWKINDHGYKIMYDRNTSESILWFKLNAELFPETSNMHDSLGEALEKDGQLKEAAECFKTAYDLAIKDANQGAAKYYKKNLDRVLQKLKTN